MWNWKFFLIFGALLACISPVLAGPTVRVSVHGEGDGAGLVVRAYRAALQSTPGVVLVAEGQPSDALLQIEVGTLRLVGGSQTGYAWAEVIIDPNGVELYGPGIVVTGKGYRDIVEVATSDVLGLDQKAFSSLRTQATPAP
jgi:hypothetical protein